MKLYYFSPYDVLRARTNTISDVRLCEGFSINGVYVELISPYIYRRDNIRRRRIQDTFGIRSQYRIVIIPTPFIENMSKWFTQPVLMFCNLYHVLRILLKNRGCKDPVVIMSRSPILLIPALVVRKLLRLKQSPIIISWAHEVIFKKHYQWVYRQSDAVVGTNSAITGDLHEKSGIERERLAISLNPITDEQIDAMITRDGARRKLEIEIDKPLVVYTGKLYKNQKEVQYLLDAARQLPEYRFLLTGGKPEVVDYFRDYCGQHGIDNITFTGFLYRYEDVIDYQQAADVLVSYYSSYDHLTRYNLPNKMCEYMLTRNPIVTCDFPATRDVLDSSNAIFVAPEDPSALAAGIRKAIENREESAALAEKAFNDVREMTFSKRTLILIGFFSGLQAGATCSRQLLP